mmetsp:Transcript_39659/g.113734  ORF Transcript_39659/g.113734 Transcript_39659/m.113734 type:complete len:216 (+) Transcript_39659:258-905(+)
MINSCEPFLFNFVATSRGVFLPEFFAALSAPKSSKAWTMSRLFSCTAVCNGKLEPEHFLRGMLMPPLKPRAFKKTSTFSWASVCAFSCACSSFNLLVSSATCRATASAAAFSSAARSASSASSRRHCCSRILACSSRRRCSWACRRQSSSSSCARRSASKRCRSCSSASVSNCSAGGGSSAGGCKGFPADSWSKVVFTFTVSVTGSAVPQALHAP